MKIIEFSKTYAYLIYLQREFIYGQRLLPCFLGENMGNKMFDALIIGGGAAGLMCAISSKQKNKNLKVAIVEKNSRVGKKLLSTGNGRCNLTNANVAPDKYHGTFFNGAKNILSHYPTQRIIDIFAKLGLLTYCDNEGRYYPLCRQASAVLDVLRFACERYGVEVFTSQNIKNLKKHGDSFICNTDDYSFKSKKLVLSNGSKASPKLGGNASAADYAKNFNHKFIPFSPALCPIEVKSDVLKSLKGLRATGKVELGNGNILRSEVGEIQFTEKALSGICIFNLSVLSKKGMKIHIDFLNNYSSKEILSLLEQNRNLFSGQSADCLLTGIFQKRLGQAVMKMAGFTNFSDKCRDIPNIQLKKIASICKNTEFEVTANCGFDQAQAALGGVCGNEIDENTMQSKKTKGLYFCGEAIDICGDCGGYNLHFAFASGHLAGANL